ncbi:MAG: CHAT domain-containing protein [Thermoguttaceae bacterium]
MRTLLNRLHLWCILLCCFFPLLIPTKLQGQQLALPAITQTVPTLEYDYACELFMEGKLTDALREFQRGLKHAVNIGGQPWIDSICYHTMIGECLYYLGDHVEAFDAYSRALNIFLVYEKWPSQIRVLGGVDVISRPATPWGVSVRQNNLAGLPKKYHIEYVTMDVTLNTEKGAQRFRNEELFPANAPEIAQCIARSIRHRAEILGPLSKFDVLNDQVLELLAARPGLPKHWSSVWFEVLYGLALSAVGQYDEALAILDRSTVMIGQLDHQLTATALCEMGRIRLRMDDPIAAGVLFYEASIAAYFFGDPIILEESFHYAAVAQRLVDRMKPLPYLVPALNFAEEVLKNRRRNVCANPFVLISLCEEIADDALTIGNLPFAKTTLDTAQGLMSNRPSFKDSRFAGRWNYLKARWAYQNGRPENIAIGNQFLETSMLNMQKNSLWINQIRYLGLLQTTGRFSSTGPITLRKAMELYDYLLREPTAKDWLMQPMDSLAVLVSPLFTPSGIDIYELWFQTAINLDYRERAFDLSEQIRRRRFYAGIPFGSRLLSFRTLLEAPSAELPRKYILVREELLQTFPALAELSKQGAMLKTTLRSLPAVPTHEEQAKKQQGLMLEIEQNSLLQELMLRSIALSSIRSVNIFPPKLSLREIQEQLPDGTSMLVFFSAVGQLHGFLIGRTHFEMWKVASNIEELRGYVAELLSALGNSSAEKIHAVKDLRENVERTNKEAKKWDWKTPGNALLTALLQGNRGGTFTELVVIPDHFLWYLPFEALCVNDVDGKLRPLIAANNGTISVRYAPTASLGVPSGTGRLVGAETLVITGKMFSKDSPEKAVERLSEYQKKLEGLIALPSGPLPGNPAIFAIQLKQLLVLDDIPSGRKGPLDWSPYGSAKLRGAELASWLDLPWGGPSLVVLPGFHTPAETALKNGGDGSELFYSLLTMQANGTKTILISRWKTGGRSMYDLIEAFLQNYTQFPASESWRKAIMSVAAKPLKLEEEPRLKLGKEEEPLRANHPFFWAGFMLVDRGEKPSREEVEEIALTAEELAELKKRFGEKDIEEVEILAEPGRDQGTKIEHPQQKPDISVDPESVLDSDSNKGSNAGSGKTSKSGSTKETEKEKDTENVTGKRQRTTPKK